jgi:hypothetical protein
MHHLRKPSTWIAVLALFVGLGGTAIAARHYRITSTRQIKPSVLRHLHGVRGPQGPAGAQGPQGPQGAQGVAGPSNLSQATVVGSSTVYVPSEEVASAVAYCPAGSKAISGGGSGGIAGIGASETPPGREGWYIIVVNETLITVKIDAEAVCAGSGQAVAASVRRQRRARTDRWVAERVATLRDEFQASRQGA